MPEYPVKMKAGENREGILQGRAPSYYKTLTDDRLPCWCNDIGEFIRSYKTLEEAKTDALKDGYINKTNFISIDYEMLQKQVL